MGWFSPERQPESFQAFVEQIQDTRSLSVLRLMIEEYRLLFDEVPEHKAVIDELWAHNNDLDQIQLICARHLGNQARVDELTQWIAGRAERRAFAREHNRELTEAFFGDILGLDKK